jgi:hypothetical protein
LSRLRRPAGVAIHPPGGAGVGAASAPRESDAAGVSSPLSSDSWLSLGLAGTCTPGLPAGRRSLLKVRFDEQTLSTPAVPGALPKTPAHAAAEVSAEDSDASERPTFLAHAEPARPLPPLRPAAELVPMPRKGGIRVLDAYGREVMEVKEEVGVKEEEEGPVHESRVRILNAMGEVVEDETIKEEPRTFADLTTADGPPMSREEALRVLKRGVAELASTMESSVPSVLPCSS